MFVDACAIVSILGEEPTAEVYEAEIDNAPAPWTSALAAWEAIIVLSRPRLLDCRFAEAESVVIEWLEGRNIALRAAASPRDILRHAVAVAEQHGLGRRALSNLDCFHYAYAKAAGDPLLTLDARMRATDVATKP
jgi:ribonuclease VapC